MTNITVPASLPIGDGKLSSGAEFLPSLAQDAGSLAALDLAQRLAAIRRAIPGRIVFTTSFGLEDQAISHAIFAQALSIEVVTLDTGRLFPETYQVWAETEHRYGRRIVGFYPEHRGLEALVAQQGIEGFRGKVEPLARALAGAAAWITGIRSEQSIERASMSYAAVEPTYGLIKVNPLFDWTRERVAAFVRAHHIPYNPLHDRGFLSIGCAPCTRALKPGEPERAGRWWWEQSEKECGLHRAVRADKAGGVLPSPMNNGGG